MLNSDATLNLLKIGYDLTNKYKDIPYHNTTAILYNLNKYLEIIINNDSTIIKNYADKLTNIEGVHLFSTLSELALANYYFMKSYDVNYFYPFQIKYNKSIWNRDIDLAIYSNDDSFLVEVYTPFYKPDDIGEFSGSSLNEITDIQNQLICKLNKKFDLDKKHLIEGQDKPVIIGIDKPLFLAINIRYDSMFSSQQDPPLNYNKVADNHFNKLQEIFRKCLENIVKEYSFSGIIIFETDFCVKDDKVKSFSIIQS